MRLVSKTSQYLMMSLFAVAFLAWLHPAAGARGVGREPASPAHDSRGQPFYGAYDAQELVEQYSEELGVGVVPFKELAYFGDDGYKEAVIGEQKKVRR